MRAGAKTAFSALALGWKSAVALPLARSTARKPLSFLRFFSLLGTFGAVFFAAQA
jgi:hypothetical protein